MTPELADFLSNLAASLIGSAFGVWLALRADHWRERHRALGEAATAAQQRIREEADQLRIVQWLVEENVVLSRQVLEAFVQGRAVFFTMNTHLLDTTLVTLVRLCEDQALLWSIEQFRYQLHHINSKLSARAETHTFQGVPTADARMFALYNLQPSIVEHAEQLVTSGTALAQQLATRIRLLQPSLPDVPRPALRISPGAV